MDIWQGHPITVLYPQELRFGIRAAVKSWEKFCALPLEEKRRFPYNDDPLRDGSGYEMKEKAGATWDAKENFHVTLRESKRSMGNVFDSEIHDAIEFIEDADALIALTAGVIQRFASRVEEAFLLPNFEQEVMSAREDWIFRYLHYFGDCEPGDHLAAPHTDKCGFTLTLYTSHSGLEYLTPTRDWQTMSVSEGMTTIIPGMKLQLASKNATKAICHRVIATEESCRSGRYSVQCFIPLLSEKRVLKKAIVGRMQDRTPGFNYDMTFPEFEQLFV